MKKLCYSAQIVKASNGGQIKMRILTFRSPLVALTHGSVVSILIYDMHGQKFHQLSSGMQEPLLYLDTVTWTAALYLYSVVCRL